MPRKVLSSNSSDANGVVVNHRSTEPKKHYTQGVNRFDNSYTQAFSQRYADIHPFMVMDGVERDDMPFCSHHELGTYTLASPLKSELYMHKTVALVPYQSILPNTWKLFYVNPTKGEDVPDDVFCNINLIKFYKDWLNEIFDNFGEVDAIEQFRRIVRFMITTERIFSHGSLLQALKLSFSSFLKYRFGSSEFDFDYYFDMLLSSIVNGCGISVVQKYGDSFYYVTTKSNFTSFDDSVNRYKVVSPHYILDVLREMDYDSFSTGIGEDGNFIDPSTARFTFGDEEYLWDAFVILFDSIGGSILSHLKNIEGYEVSLERPIAYQLAVAKFHTDDSIDNIYNANIFRNNFTALFEYGDMFSWNGQPIVYDVFSQHNLEKAFMADTFEMATSLLFSFRKSLKYGDYFISSRPNPYAIGDVNAPVVNNFVSAIDITRKLSEQRFLNWNNRTGMTYEDYVEGLTGVRPTIDPTEPLFVCHEKFQIFGMEVENTGSAQLEAGTNSVTTLLKSNASKWLYNIGITDACIVIGLSHFDSKRLYTKIMDRNNLKSNRFDFFNKFYQYTGDQEIKGVELDASRPINENFSYTTRYMQYKQQVSHAGGAFLGALKTWAMIADNEEDMSFIGQLNSDFIRNLNSTFDKFYSSLSALSLGNYFHFAVVHYNDFSDMRRAMDIAPDIL